MIYFDVQCSVVRDGMNAFSKWVEEGKINPRSTYAALPIEKVKVDDVVESKSDWEGGGCAAVRHGVA